MNIYKHYAFVLSLLLLITKGISAQQVISRADAMNILYAGIDNPITVVADVPIKDIKLEVADAYIIPVVANKYLIHPLKLGTLTLYFKYKNKIIGEEKYRVKSIPLATARIGTIEDEGKYTINEFNKQTGLKLEFLDFESSITVLSFRLRVIRDGIKIGDLVNDGALFTSATKLLLATILSGDEIVVSDVKYQINQTTNSLNLDNKKIYNSVNPFINIKIY